ncbi:hypothetical protein [Myxococcus faecalis]|uniref:hypothetical protein n=1 Tax=Myxococcus faecalis TaxID=3115646 RepID=UPI003CF8C911
MMRENLWDPRKTLVAKLKATPYGTTGKSDYDFTSRRSWAARFRATWRASSPRRV